MINQELLNEILASNTTSSKLSTAIERLKVNREVDKTPPVNEFLLLLDALNYQRELLLALELREQALTMPLEPYWEHFSKLTIAIEVANKSSVAQAKPDDASEKRQLFRNKLIELGYSDVANGPLKNVHSPD